MSPRVGKSYMTQIFSYVNTNKLKEKGAFVKGPKTIVEICFYIKCKYVKLNMDGRCELENWYEVSNGINSVN